MYEDKVTYVSGFGERFGPVDRGMADAFIKTGLETWCQRLGLPKPEKFDVNTPLEEQLRVYGAALHNLNVPFMGGVLGKVILGNYNDDPEVVKERLKQAREAWSGKAIDSKIIEHEVKVLLNSDQRSEPIFIYENAFEQKERDLKIKEKEISQKEEKISDLVRAEKENITDHADSLKSDFIEKLNLAILQVSSEKTLEKANKFWTDRKKSGNYQAIVFGIIFISGLIAAGVGSWVLSKSAKADLSALYSTGCESCMTLIQQITPFLLPATIGALAIWFLRLIARQFITARHQAYDAGERLTTLDTYLALLKMEGQHAITDKERVLF